MNISVIGENSLSVFISDDRKDNFYFYRGFMIDDFKDNYYYRLMTDDFKEVSGVQDGSGLDVR